MSEIFVNFAQQICIRTERWWLSTLGVCMQGTRCKAINNERPLLATSRQSYQAESAKKRLTSAPAFGGSFKLTAASKPQSCETFGANTTPDEQYYGL